MNSINEQLTKLSKEVQTQTKTNMLTSRSFYYKPHCPEIQQQNPNN